MQLSCNTIEIEMFLFPLHVVDCLDRYRYCKEFTFVRIIRFKEVYFSLFLF